MARLERVLGGKRAQGTPAFSSALAAGRGAKGRWAGCWAAGSASRWRASTDEYLPTQATDSIYCKYRVPPSLLARFAATTLRRLGALSLPDGTRTVPAPECADRRLHRLGPLFVISRPSIVAVSRSSRAPEALPVKPRLC